MKIEKRDPESLENKKSQAVALILSEYQSFGWLTRFLTHRHSKIKVKCWQLLCELIDTNLLSSQSSLLQDAMNAILRQSELYGIKIKAMDFLSRSLLKLINQEDIEEKQTVTVESVLDIIKKSGFISR